MLLETVAHTLLRLNTRCDNTAKYKWFGFMLEPTFVTAPATSNDDVASYVLKMTQK